jgi:hypothetical protein
MKQNELKSKRYINIYKYLSATSYRIKIITQMISQTSRHNQTLYKKKDCDNVTIPPYLSKERTQLPPDFSSARQYSP